MYCKLGKTINFAADRTHTVKGLHASSGFNTVKNVIYIDYFPNL